MKDVTDAVIPPQPRDYHGWNWSGFFTLYQREIRRFWKVGTQTVAAPVVTTLRQGELIDGLEGDAYLAVARERDELIRSH